MKENKTTIFLKAHFKWKKCTVLAINELKNKQLQSRNGH